MGRPQTLKEIFPGFWQILKRFSPYIAPYRGKVAIAFLALFAEVFLRLLEPWPLKIAFDGVIAPGSAEGDLVEELLSDRLPPTVILAIAALGLVLITLLRAIAAYGSTIAFAIVGNRVLSQVRHDLYRHLQNLSLTFHHAAKGGDLTIRVISDVGLLKDVIVTAFLPLLGNIMILIGMVAFMTYLNAELMLWVLLLAPLFWLSTLRLGKDIRASARQQRQKEGAMAATTAESMQAIKILKTFSLEEVFARTFATHNQGSLKVDVRTKRLEAQLERTVDVLIAISTALVLGRGSQLVLEHTLTPGDLLVFLTYLKNAFKPVRDFAKYTGRLAKATAAGERILDLLDRQPAIYDRPDAIVATSFLGRVRLANLTFGYNPEQPVLKRINLIVLPGQTVALVGASGAGKSTWVSLLLRLYEPTSGQILIDGRDIRSYTLESLRSQISVVLQESLLFAASIRENIAYGKPNARDAEIIAAAKLANAHEFITQLPQGYETELGERGVTLSGGQRQRIAIARAAIRNAPILLLDEPTTGLDQENESAVVEALERLAKDKTTFLVAHDLSLATRADLILYLQDGTIQEQGTHAELMAQNGFYAALYRLQVLSRSGSAQKAAQKEDEHALFG
jgi:ATP-binding cassette, subfamily B, bacterial